jgi:hypothetical protein
MVVNGTEVACDLWSNSAQANTTASAPAAASSNDDEMPF